MHSNGCTTARWSLFMRIPPQTRQRQQNRDAKVDNYEYKFHKKTPTLKAADVTCPPPSLST